MNKATFKEYRGYTPLIWHSAEDGCFVGSIAGLDRHGISFEGATEEEVRKDLENAIDFYLDTEPMPEKPFSGRIVLHVSPAIHEALCRKAQDHE